MSTLNTATHQPAFFKANTATPAAAPPSLSFLELVMGTPALPLVAESILRHLPVEDLRSIARVDPAWARTVEDTFKLRSLSPALTRKLLSLQWREAAPTGGLSHAACDVDQHPDDRPVAVASDGGQVFVLSNHGVLTVSDHSSSGSDGCQSEAPSRSFETCLQSVGGLACTMEVSPDFVLVQRPNSKVMDETVWAACGHGERTDKVKTAVASEDNSEEKAAARLVETATDVPDQVQADEDDYAYGLISHCRSVLVPRRASVAVRDHHPGEEIHVDLPFADCADVVCRDTVDKVNGRNILKNLTYLHSRQELRYHVVDLDHKTGLADDSDGVSLGAPVWKIRVPLSFAASCSRGVLTFAAVKGNNLAIVDGRGRLVLITLNSRGKISKTRVLGDLRTMATREEHKSPKAAPTVKFLSSDYLMVRAFGATAFFYGGAAVSAYPHPEHDLCHATHHAASDEVRAVFHSSSSCGGALTFVTVSKHEVTLEVVRRWSLGRPRAVHPVGDAGGLFLLDYGLRKSIVYDLEDDVAGKIGDVLGDKVCRLGVAGSDDIVAAVKDPKSGQSKTVVIKIKKAKFLKSN